jgi:ABC-type Na+ efflux pump permease subunit
MNALARYLGTFVACLLLLGVAVRAAGSISGERERQTLDSLLSSPLSNQDILWGKWLGSITCGRKIWWYLAAVWLAAVFTSGLHPLALPLLVAAYTVYAVFLASLGTWFSLVSRNSLRATVWTVVTVLTCSLGPWLLGFVYRILMALFYPMHGWTALNSGLGSGPPYARTPDPPAAWLGSVLPLLAPHSALSFLAFSEHELQPDPIGYAMSNGYDPEYGANGASLWVKLAAVVLILMLYASVAVILWGLARARFAQMTGRVLTSGGVDPRRGPPGKPGGSSSRRKPGGSASRRGAGDD